ncbi:MAG: hypothetical protein FJX47_19215, partial [Alphaproteobacteria bacterium]|nr:hypothetical protein [Alphaproteobacteria bacterium]
VWEWTEDCWNDNYNGAPSDGSAWQTGFKVEGIVESTCFVRMLRGGSWAHNRIYARSAKRWELPNTSKGNDYGFRVARTY